MAAALAIAAMSLSACGGSSGGSAAKTTAGSASGGSSAAKVTVPSVTGQEEQFAVARLQKMGLEPTSRRRYGSEKKGLVLKSDPPGGSLVPRATRITVYVSRGSKPTTTASAAPGAGAGSGTSGASGSSVSGGSGSGGGCPSGEYLLADGSCGHPSQNGGAPADTHRGHKQLQQNPDCQNAPPPPPGYKGPVQC